MYRTLTTMPTAAACVLAAVASAAHAQDYPNRTVRLVTIEAGGGNDNIARLLAQGLSGGLGQQVIVDNRGGASGVIAVDLVAKSQADGYTLLSLSGSMWTLPFMQSVPYDPVRDFAPISLTVSAPNILVIHPLLPVKNVKELIALARSRPGDLNYSSAGSGSSGHLSAELFNAMARVNVVRIAYKGGAPAMTDLIAGRVQLSFTSAASSLAHVKNGKLRALAVTSARESALAPGIPPVATQGLPGYELISTYGFFAPARTPAVVITRLHQETVKALNTSDLRERYFRGGAEIVANTPQEFAAIIRSDQAKLGKLIRDAGIKSE